jgi:hypothetical protein
MFCSELSQRNQQLKVVLAVMRTVSVPTIKMHENVKYSQEQ